MRTFRAATVALAMITTAIAPQQAFAQRHDLSRHIEKKIDRKVEKKKTRSAIIGAGIGLLGGALISNGDPWAAIAGAAAGGAVGHSTVKDPRDRYRGRDHWRDRDRDRDWYRDRDRRGRHR